MRTRPFKSSRGQAGRSRGGQEGRALAEGAAATAGAVPPCSEGQGKLSSHAMGTAIHIRYK